MIKKSFTVRVKKFQSLLVGPLMFSIKKVSILPQVFSSDTSTKYSPSNKLSTEKSVELLDQTAL